MDEKVKKISEVKAHMTREAFRIYDEMAAKLPPASSTLKEVKFSSSMINVIGRCYFKRGYIKFSLPTSRLILITPSSNEDSSSMKLLISLFQTTGPHLSSFAKNSELPTRGAPARVGKSQAWHATMLRPRGSGNVPTAEKDSCTNYPRRTQNPQKEVPKLQKPGIKIQFNLIFFSC